MKLATYPLIGSPAATIFRFVSQGPRGAIAKLIQFELVSEVGPVPIYNLAFGDGTDVLDDLAVSDNGDADKVLATIVEASRLFLAAHPTALLYATGSTPARTRLYHIGLTRYLAAIRSEVLLFGILQGEPEPFEPGQPYEAFVAQLLSS